MSTAVHLRVPAFAFSLAMALGCGGEVTVYLEEGPCTSLDTPRACNESTACRWLVPGCAGKCSDCPPAGPEGCFPIDDCQPGMCDSGETCTIVVHDPCPDGECRACGSEVAICLSGE